jgi:hypothetical protein
MALSPRALCSVADIFAYMRKEIPDQTASDYILVENLINRASDEIERYIGGPVINREITEQHNAPSYSRLVMNHYPIVSLTSVLDNGVDRTSELTFVPNSGILMFKGGGRFSSIPYGVEVTYTAGRGADMDSIPQNIRQACVLIVHFWFKRDSADYSQTYGEADIILNGPRFPVTALKMIETYKDVVV